jgi:hypothetical protein
MPFTTPSSPEYEVPSSPRAPSNSCSRCRWRRTRRSRVPHRPAPVGTWVEADHGCCIPLRRRSACVYPSFSPSDSTSVMSPVRSEDHCRSTLSKKTCGTQEVGNPDQIAAWHRTLPVPDGALPPVPPHRGAGHFNCDTRWLRRVEHNGINPIPGAAQRWERPLCVGCFGIACSRDVASAFALR